MKKKARKVLPPAPENSVAPSSMVRDDWPPDYEETGNYDAEIPDPESYCPAGERTAVHPALVEMLNVVAERNRIARDRQLWVDGATNSRPLSEKILGPIKRALREQGWLQILATSGEGSLSDESMAKLFRYSLEPLQRTLGRIVLDAIIDGDRQFAACVDAAVKDADALFHRGTIEHGTMNEAFFKWHRNISDEEWPKLTAAIVRKQFEEVHRTLNNQEWAALKCTFHVEFLRLQQTRRGRPTKAVPKNP